MLKREFIGHVLRYIGIYEGRSGANSGYIGKSSHKAQEKSDLQTHNTQFGRRRDMEKWRKTGAALRRLSNRVDEDRVRVLSERSGVDSIATREDAQQEANLTRCLRGVSAKFWSSGARVFCAYYEKDSDSRGKYGMYFAVFTESDTRVIRVSDAVFTKSEAKRAPPDFVMREEGDTQKVIFTFLVQKEREEEAAGQELSFLCVYQCTIREQDRSIVTEQLSSSISSKNYLGFEGPLGITVHSDGNIMVIGKYKDPFELPPSDVGYFAWRFSGADLAPIKAEDSQPSHKTYLFCILGGSAYKDSERMVMWKDERENQISITHIDKRLVRQRSVYSTVYEVRNVDMIYRDHIAEKCLLESFRCGIAGPKTSVLRNEDMYLMDNVSVEDARYIFYISQESDRRANGTVDMLMFSGDTYMLIEGVFRIEFSATSLSVNPANNGDISIFLTEKGGKRAHVYEIPSGDELFKSEISVKTATIDFRNAGRREFMDTISGGLPLHGTVETVTELETSITNGSLKNRRNSKEYKGSAKIADYGIYELKNNVPNPSHVVTEKGAQSAADAEHHTVKREVSVSETITTPVEPILTVGEGSSVSSTVVEDLPREEPSSTTSPPLLNSAGTTAISRIVAAEVHRGMIYRYDTGGHVVTATRALVNISKAIVRGIASTARSYGSLLPTRRRLVSLADSLGSKESRGNERLVMFAVIAAVIVAASAAAYVYKLLKGGGRGESSPYRNIHDDAAEEGVNSIQLEPRNTPVGEIPSTLSMDSISESLTSYDCGSVHEL